MALLKQITVNDLLPVEKFSEEVVQECSEAFTIKRRSVEASLKESHIVFKSRSIME